MKEFIFTWNIENISYSWHKIKEVIKSPLFVADNLQNTVWHLGLYPKGYQDPEWLSLYLYKSNDEGRTHFSFSYELSCVSANNLTLASFSFDRLKASEARATGVGKSKFLKIQEVFVQRKNVYLQRDTLTLRCRIWINKGVVDVFGQCFGCTRLEVERVLSVEDLNPKINNKTVLIHSYNKDKLLVSIDVSIEKDCLKIESQPVNTEQIKYSTLKISITGKNGKSCEFINSTDKPCKELWKPRIRGRIGSNLKLTCEFSYSTGQKANTIEMISPSSFKYPEFPLHCILPCIPSGKLSDCPSICKDLWDLYLKQIFCDLELKTQTTSFWVHEFVLCARSPVFLAMFTNDMNEKMRKCVKIEDLEDDTLEKLIKFLYTDTFEENHWDAVLELYYSADKYQVGLLKIFCGSYFIDNIDYLKVCELLMLSDKHNDSDLKWQVEDYISRHYFAIFKTQQWKEFAEKQPLWAARIMIREYRAGEKRNLSSHPNAIDDFRSLLQKVDWAGDVTIQTRIATLSARKFMLCAGSPRLMELLTSNQSSDSLKMDDLENDTVSQLLLFLHTDSLGNINSEIATNLYKAAFTYQIERLKVKCSCFFIENLEVSNAGHLLQLAHDHGDVKLKSLVEDFISLLDLKISISTSLPKLNKTGPPKRMETRRSKRLRLEKDT